VFTLGPGRGRCKSSDALMGSKLRFISGLQEWRVCVCGKKSIKAVFAVVRYLFMFGTLRFYWQTPGLMQCLLDQQYVPNRLIYWIGGLE